MMTSEYFIAVKETSLSENMDFQLHTPRLLLKELTTSDAQDLFEYRSLPEVILFQGWAPTSVEDAIQFIQEDICHTMDQPGTWFQLGIFLRAEQKMIGDLGMHFLVDENQSEKDQTNHDTRGEVEIGITIAPPYQGSGVASEAISHVLDFLFNSLCKSKVVASVDPKNLKSMALMKRVGFLLESISKNAVLFRGEWTDDAVFIMTQETWQNHQQNQQEHNL